VAATSFAEKDMELADLQKQAKLFVQKETAANKEKKSLEAQVCNAEGVSTFHEELSLIVVSGITSD